MAVLVSLVLLAGCAASSQPLATPDALPTGLVGPVAPTAGPDALRYVAIGDTYTYGDGVQQSDRWPNQLVRILRPELDLDLVANLASLSTLTTDLIQDQLPRLASLRPDFVTVQVGANDVYFRTRATAYAANVARILDAVLGSGVPPDRIVVLTTPDFTLTPGGQDRIPDPYSQRALIAEFNTILKTAAAARGITVVDIAPISDRVTLDPSLLAADKLHPSGKQYAGWADLMADTVRRLFRAAVASPDVSGPSVAP